MFFLLFSFSKSRDLAEKHDALIRDYENNFQKAIKDNIRTFKQPVGGFLITSNKEIEIKGKKK